MSETKVLIINQSAPYGSSSARESLDVALTCAIFDMPVSLLFLGDGVFQLLKAQQPEQIQQKKLEAMLSALPMYDVDQLYVIEEDLEERQLGTEHLLSGVQTLARSAMPSLIQQHNTVLSF